MKIQDSSFQWLSLGTIDSMRKSAVSSGGQSENLTDIYISSGDLTRIEKGVFQLLKDVIGEFKDTIDGLLGNGQSKVLPDFRVRLSETTRKSPIPEHNMMMLVLTGKGKEEKDDAQTETQVKLFISYNVDVPNSETFRSADFLGKVAYEAKQFAIEFARKETVEGDNAHKGDASIESPRGFVFLFSYAGKGLDREAATTSMPAGATVEPGGGMPLISVRVPAGTSDDATDAISVSFIDHGMSDKVVNGHDALAVSLSFIAHAESDEQIKRTYSDASLTTTEPAIVYGTLGKNLNAQDVDALTLDGIGESDIFKKLFAFIAGTRADNAQYISTFRTTAEEPSVSPIHEGKQLVVMSFGIQLSENDAIMAVATTAKNRNQPIIIDEGVNEGGGTTLNAGYGQGELKSSPMAGPPLFSFENELIVSKTEAFVNHLNMLLGENADVNSTIDGVKTDEETFSEISPAFLRLLKTASPEMRAVVQNITKKIFSNFNEIPGVELTGFSVKENGTVGLNTSTLISQLTSNREETINAVRSFGNTLIDRINYLINPYAGIYVDDKNVLSMRATQKDEGTSFQDKEMQKEQDFLEKRLNELKILIEDSQLLTEWFKQNGIISVNDEYKTDVN